MNLVCVRSLEIFCCTSRKMVVKRSFFLGQVMALKFYEQLDLDIPYSLVKEYNEELALAVAQAHHQGALEDVRLSFCDYLKGVLILNSMTEEEVINTEKKIMSTAKIRITNDPDVPRVLTFREFARLYCLFSVYKYGDRSFDSTTHTGREAGSGYLNFILRTHRDGRSWNGSFSEDDLVVVIVGKLMDFRITLPPLEDFHQESGVADCNMYFKILEPFYKSSVDSMIPLYMDKLQKHCLMMPHYDPSDPAPFNRFQKFVGRHMCWKPPLVRAVFISRLYKFIVQNRDNAVFANVMTELSSTPEIWSQAQKYFCHPRQELYKKSKNDNESPQQSRYCEHSLWTALWLARNAIEHLGDYPEENGVKLLTDIVIIDLVLENYLLGILSDVVYKVMELTSFDNEFASIWALYDASEMLDVGGGSAPAGEMKKEENSSSSGLRDDVSS